MGIATTDSEESSPWLTVKTGGFRDARGDVVSCQCAGRSSVYCPDGNCGAGFCGGIGSVKAENQAVWGSEFAR